MNSGMKNKHPFNQEISPNEVVGYKTSKTFYIKEIEETHQFNISHQTTKLILSDDPEYTDFGTSHHQKNPLGVNDRELQSERRDIRRIRVQYCLNEDSTSEMEIGHLEENVEENEEMDWERRMSEHWRYRRTKFSYLRPKKKGFGHF